MRQLTSILTSILLPLLLVLVFGLALLVVTARTFLPGDMAAPAPLSVLFTSPLPV
ncbi:MAG: hypothetical protein IGQ88_05915 [Gloeomargaritaceae cyanobacterium C42_A2020_066]|nr:hypothetical protein [Gloeomargaritaceae cyanobacterium C42_A2020_066]